VLRVAERVVLKYHYFSNIVDIDSREFQDWLKTMVVERTSVSKVSHPYTHAPYTRIDVLEYYLEAEFRNQRSL